MPSIKISDFKGKSPRVSEKLLPGDFAQTANNCDLLRGKISAVKDFESEVETGNLIDDPVTIYKFEDTWCSWDKDTDVVRSPLGTDTPRIYMSNGLAYPKQSSIRMTNLRGAFFWMGAATPTGSPFEATAYIYITVDGVGLLPLPDPDESVLTVPILVGDTADQVATKIATVIQAAASFVTATVIAPGNVVEVKNASVGYCTPPISSDCGFIVKTTILGNATTAQECTITVPKGPDPTSGAGYPRLTWRLGVPAPNDALAVTIAGEGDGYPIKSVNWVYTYVTAWGEESKPSPATETVDIEGTAQKTNVTCEETDMLTTNAGVGRYFTFSTTVTNYYCWYTIDDNGSDPAPAGTGIKVELLGVDNPDQIADKIATAINTAIGAQGSATADGKLVTITNSSNGLVTVITEVNSDFILTTTQLGTASLPQISTVNTERLIHGSYFVLHTALEDDYYVWYQLAATPSILIDFTGQNIIEGDYFYFYLLYPKLNPDIYKTPYEQKKIVVYFGEIATEGWVIQKKYYLNDLVFDFYEGVKITYRCIATTSQGPFPPYMRPAEWEPNPGCPDSEDGVYKYLRAGFNTGAVTNDFAKSAYEEMVDSDNGLTDVANFSYDPGDSTITITHSVSGDIEADPAAANAAAPNNPNLTFTDSFGSLVSDDPGVPGKTGIEVKIIVTDDATVIAEKTAEAINDSDAFSCAKPYSATITIVNDRGGLTTAAEDGNTGFEITELQAGAVQTASFVMPAIPATNTDVNISHIRLYRLVTADNGSAEYQYVPPYAPYDEEAVYAVGDFVSYSGDGYYCFVVPVAGVLPTTATNFAKLNTLDLPVDVALLDGIKDEHPYDSTLAEVLPTENWDMPPDDLHGLTLFDNGITAGFSKNRVYVSEPLYPYAFPDDYSLLFPETIVGLGYMPGTIIVLTEGAPQGIIGNDPTTLSQTPFPYPQPCISKRGITMTENGVIYPCPDGLFMISQNGGSLVTKPLYTKVQWSALSAEHFIGTYFDGKVFYSVDGSNTSSFIDFQETLFVVDFDHTLPDDKENYTYDMISDGDDLYYLLKKETAATYEIYKYRGATTYKTFTWKSKKYQWPYLTNFACGRVIADWATDPTVTVTLYVDGVLKQTIAVTDSNVFRLVSGFTGRIIEIQITGAVDVDFFGISQTPMDISL